MPAACMAGVVTAAAPCMGSNPSAGVHGGADGTWAGVSDGTPVTGVAAATKEQGTGEEGVWAGAAGWGREEAGGETAAAPKSGMAAGVGATALAGVLAGATAPVATWAGVSCAAGVLGGACSACARARAAGVVAAVAVVAAGTGVQLASAALPAGTDPAPCQGVLVGAMMPATAATAVPARVMLGGGVRAAPVPSSTPAPASSSSSTCMACMPCKPPCSNCAAAAVTVTMATAACAATAWLDEAPIIRGVLLGVGAGAERSTCCLTPTDVTPVAPSSATSAPDARLATAAAAADSTCVDMGSAPAGVLAGVAAAGAW